MKGGVYNERLGADERMELLRVLRPRQWPKPRSRSPGENDWNNHEAPQKHPQASMTGGKNDQKQVSSSRSEPQMHWKTDSGPDPTTKKTGARAIPLAPRRSDAAADWP